jgi:hypothetical protein
VKKVPLESLETLDDAQLIVEQEINEEHQDSPDVIRDTSLETILRRGEISGIGLLPPSPDKRTAPTATEIASPAWEVLKENTAKSYGKRTHAHITQPNEVKLRILFL